MVYFFHELTIQRGEGTIIEVIKCYVQSCLIAVDMPKTLQTKCKTCFGGPKPYWDILQVRTKVDKVHQYSVNCMKGHKFKHHSVPIVPNVLHLVINSAPTPGHLNVNIVHIDLAHIILSFPSSHCLFHHMVIAFTLPLLANWSSPYPHHFHFLALL